MSRNLSVQAPVTRNLSDQRSQIPASSSNIQVLADKLHGAKVLNRLKNERMDRLRDRITVLNERIVDIRGRKRQAEDDADELRRELSNARSHTENVERQLAETKSQVAFLMRENALIMCQFQPQYVYIPYYPPPATQ